ncbi:aspartyl protease family protein [Sphingomonas azotifigens]|uniref:aspartyl protease family protein n=1 Tax=Sphingomonas azotifigens TaxID=330920 RepID=UPI001C3FEA8E|nr:aspartyl protease family protein [Sphingomonas azotifigens]
MAPSSAPNPHLSVRIEGLLDTGATGTGIRVDVAEALGLRPKGQRRVMTASETVFSSEYLMRIGFVCGDYTDPAFVADQQLPFVLEEPVLGFELHRGFGYAMLIGMDLIGAGDLSITRDGFARFLL